MQGKTIEQPHFQFVIVQLVTVGDIVGVSALIAFNVDAENVSNLVLETVEGAIGNGIILGVGGPFAVELRQCETLFARCRYGVGNPDAFDELVHFLLF